MIFAEQVVRFSAVGLGLLYGGTKLGQGRDSVKDLLEDNVEMWKEMEQKLKDKLMSGSIAIAEEKTDDKD